MKIADYYDMEVLRNNSEHMVLERIGKLLDERSDLCTCEQCVLDLVAYVLNNIPPDYGTSLIGSFDPDQAKAKKTKEMIEVALKDGIAKVKRNPNHA